MGAAAGAAGQVLTIVLIAKTCTKIDLGRYALALAVVTPAMLFARLQLRHVLASEPSAPAALYDRTRRLVGTAAAALLSLGGALWLDPAAASALALLAWARYAESIGELRYALWQRRDDWNRVAASQALHGLGGAAVIGLALLPAGSLPTALTANLAWQTVVTLGFDQRRAEPALAELPSGGVFTTLQRLWPLGAAAALVSLNANIPRYALERASGLEAVGVFAALSQLALVGNLPVQALGQAALTRLGERASSSRAAFVRLALALLLGAATIGVLGTAVATAWGDGLLALLYAPGWQEYRADLVWMMLGAGATYLTAMLGYALLAAGERRAQLVAFGISALAALVAAVWLTPGMGLRGAILANLIAWATAALLTAGALLLRLRRMPASDCQARAHSPTLSAWLLRAR